jgi:hypothetical protein
MSGDDQWHPSDCTCTCCAASKKTLGQVAYEAAFPEHASWKRRTGCAKDRWERAAQAVITTYEAQKQVCSADTGRIATEPRQGWASWCGGASQRHMAIAKVQS